MDVGEIDESVGAGVQEVGRLTDCHRLLRKVLGLVVATLSRDDLARTLRQMTCVKRSSLAAGAR